MAYYRTCPTCGANLELGERCDCTEERREVLTLSTILPPNASPEAQNERTEKGYILKRDAENNIRVYRRRVCAGQNKMPLNGGNRCKRGIGKTVSTTSIAQF